MVAVLRVAVLLCTLVAFPLLWGGFHHLGASVICSRSELGFGVLVAGLYSLALFE